MKAWSTWFNDVIPSVPGCGTDLVTHELRRAAQDFFAKSLAWGVILDAVSVGIAESEVEVLPDDQQQTIVRIDYSAWGGYELGVRTSELMQEAYGPDWMDQTGTPSDITQLMERTVRLVPSPTVAGSLRCRCKVKPSDTSTGLPDALAFQYRDAIAEGAKARLMLMPKKPWTDAALAAVAQMKFDAAINTAKSASFRAFGRARTAAKPVWC